MFQVESDPMPCHRSILLILLVFLTLPAVAKPFLRVDLRNGEKVPPHFHISGKTTRGCIVLVEVSSWDGFGAQFETYTDQRGYFSLPVAVHGRTVTTHVDIRVRSFDPRRGGEKEIKRYVILDRNLQK